MSDKKLNDEYSGIFKALKNELFLYDVSEGRVPLVKQDGIKLEENPL